jgi:hypothetical protein
VRVGQWIGTWVTATPELPSMHDEDNEIEDNEIEGNKGGNG